MPPLVTPPEFNENADAKDLVVLPSSPTVDSYQPVTLTGRTTPTEDLSPTQSTRTRKPPGSGVVTRSATAAARQAEADKNRSSARLASQPSVPEMSYEEQLNAAIAASLECCVGGSGAQDSNDQIEPLKELGTEDEQMSKAMEESLAMSSSRTLENSGRFTHPSPPQRVRASGK